MSSTTQAGPGSTRDRLLEAAWLVIRDDGLRAATSRAITARAGANLGAITYYFGSKRALVTAAAVGRIGRWTGPLAAALSADEGDAGDRAVVLIPQLLQTLEGAEGDVRALLELVVAPDVDADVREALRNHLAEFQAFVAALLARRQQRGEMPTSLDPVATAGLFTAVALGLMTQNYIGANPTSVQAMVEELLAMLASVSPARPTAHA